MNWCFNALCLPHRSDMIAHARRLCHDIHRAEDLVQDAYLRAFQDWPRFVPVNGTEPSVYAKAWLRRIVTNLAVDGFRRAKLAERDPADLLMATYGRDVDHVEPVEFGGRVGRDVTSALLDLEPEFREVVEHVLVNEQPYRDCADAIGIPIGTVMSRLSRARSKLRANLATFANREYGLNRAHVSADRFEPTEKVQPERNSVERVMLADGDFALSRAQPRRNARAAR